MPADGEPCSVNATVADELCSVNSPRLPSRVNREKTLVQ